MGLLEDVIGGVLRPQTGARAGRGGGQAASGGMSPIMMAMMAFLAYRALSGGKSGAGGGLGDILGGILGGGQPSGSAPPRRGPQAQVPDDEGGGGLDDILGQILGGGSAGAPPARGDAGSGLDELSDIVERFDRGGQGPAARSWVSPGANQPISPDQMNAVLDDGTVEQLSAATGVGRDELLAGLARVLPGVVDQLTPDGRLPTPEEWRRRF